MTAAARPIAVVVMGVSGTGKSTVGRLLAERLRVAFIDGDDLHSAANKRKMASGQPLTDEDRMPWLDRVGARLAEGDVVIACSALRRTYRDRLRAAARGIRFVYLAADRELIGERLRRRSDHFMPESLLGSQFATLEPPAPDEDALTVDASRAPAEIVERAAEWVAGAR